MNSISEYVDSDAAARFGLFRSTSDIEDYLTMTTPCQGIVTRGLTGERVFV